MFEGVLLDPFLSEERVYERLKREFQKYGKLIIAYDFDYTINSYRNEPWEYPEVVQLLQRWAEYGYFICYTASPESRHPEIREKIKELGVPLNYINENVKEVKISQGGKLYYNVLLCDRAGLAECHRVLKKLITEIEEGRVKYEK